MSLPLSTTTVTTQRRTAGDQRDQGAYGTLASGLAAHITVNGGSEVVQSGSTSRVDAHLDVETTDLAHDDRVVDDTTGITWEVAWATKRVGLGLDRTEAGLYRVVDRVSA